MTPNLSPSEQAVLQAAAAIFAATTEGLTLADAEAKDARKYALTQAYLLALSVKEMAKEG